MGAAAGSPGYGFSAAVGKWKTCSDSLMMPWYALYTKPRNEKKLTSLLQAKGMTAWCPMQETLKQWSDRRKKVKAPLISSYIFVKLEEIGRASCRERVCQYV